MKKYHFIGIGGIGMSALAHMLLDQNKQVSGSDLASTKQTNHLARKGAMIMQGHHHDHVQSEHTVIYSSAVKKNNPEYLAALDLKCPLLHRSQLLAELMQGKMRLAVTGTHGKTSTTALLTHVLLHAGLDPSYAIGGLLAERNGYVGKGKHFVFEADESDGTFEVYHPDCAIVTNLEPEHLDHYTCFDHLKAACHRFCQSVGQQLFYCGDDPILREYGLGISYGFDPSCQVRILHTASRGFGQDIVLKDLKGAVHTWYLPLLGRHQACNAAAVFALAQYLGMTEEVIVAAMATFPGVARRMHQRAQRHHVLMLDDYAHHPTEVRVTLEGLKEAIQERRLVVLFQPHRYTRTRDLFQEFTQAFEAADLLLITDIYAASEAPIEGISAEKLVEEIQKTSSLPCLYIPRQAWESIQDLLRPHDVFISMGAGDVTSVHDRLHPSRKYRVGVCFGGKSCEHEVSIRSANFVRQSLREELYDVEPFFIDKEGQWGQSPESPTCSPLDPLVAAKISACDVFFPVLHGPYGEDGTLQGFFEILGQPYVGCDCASAALAMHKMQSKMLAQAHGVLTPRALSFSSHQWKKEKNTWLEQAKKLCFPVFVKPVHLGSSVGITKVLHIQDLEQAVSYALGFDHEVMIEESVESAREIEFAVMGNYSGAEIRVPRPGEKLAQGQFVSYNMKYSSQPVPTTVEADFLPDVLEQGQEAASRVYRALGCCGMARVDFLLDQEQRWWFFEINPIPGMTNLSQFPKIWKREGVAAEDLMDQLMILGLAQHRVRRRHTKLCHM